MAAITLRLASIYARRGEGDRATSSARQALHMRKLSPADDTQARAILAIGVVTNRGRF